MIGFHRFYQDILALLFGMAFGLVHRHRKYFHISPWHIWRWMLFRGWSRTKMGPRVGYFKNVDIQPQGRWGIYILGFEIGSRDNRDPVGLWLREKGLWRW